MGRCKGIRHFHELCESVFTDRYTVAQENDRSAAGIEVLGDLGYRNDTLGAHDCKAQVPGSCICITAFPFINSGIDLLAARVHQGTDQSVSPIEIIGNRIYCGDRNDRSVHCQRSALCRCHADPESRERTRSLSDGNGVHSLQVQLQHAFHLIHHGNQTLRVFPFILNIIIRGQKTVLKKGTARDRARRLYCQYFHIYSYNLLCTNICDENYALLCASRAPASLQTFGFRMEKAIIILFHCQAHESPVRSALLTHFNGACAQ